MIIGVVFSFLTMSPGGDVTYQQVFERLKSVDNAQWRSIRQIALEPGTPVTPDVRKAMSLYGASASLSVRMLNEDPADGFLRDDPEFEAGIGLMSQILCAHAMVQRADGDLQGAAQSLDAMFRLAKTSAEAVSHVNARSAAGLYQMAMTGSELVHDARRWEVIVEPDPADQLLVVITAYPVESP